MILQYWYLIALALVALGFVATRYMKGKARKVALQYLLAAEKMTFTAVEAHLEVVTNVAYAALPAPIKVYITKDMFATIVKAAYEEVKELIGMLHEDESVPLQKVE
ncbi:hypothetical protein ACS2BX_25900 [Bacillus cereus group sp. BceL300]|uniref:hypothetical protein n=1 Tax=Bacillus cereus group TaxID=86661 RepID=UPI00254DDBAF|nr:hypothetical protein [Bacillus cereus]MDK7480995.1 hypothetical protein [Bacillus cereus]